MASFARKLKSRGEAIAAWARQSPYKAGVIALLSTWGVYFLLVWPRVFHRVTAGGVVAGTIPVWADWAVHYTYANVFAYRPPSEWLTSNPVFATQPFNYPFIADAICGLLMRMGFDSVGAFLLPSFLTSLLFLLLLFHFYRGELKTSVQALLGVTLFLANGGLGFWLFLRNLRFDRVLDMLAYPPLEYTNFPDAQIQWANIVTTELLPQRSLLLGMTVGLFILVVLKRWLGAGIENVRWFKLLLLGVLTGLLISIHAHTLLTLFLLAPVLCWIYRPPLKPAAIYVAGGALVWLFLLAVVRQIASSATPSQGFFSFHPGWLGNPENQRELSLLVFYLLNWGLFLPLAIWGTYRRKLFRNPFVIVGFLIFLLCNLIQFQPNLWDNTKLFTWSHCFLVLPVAGYLADLWASRQRLARTATVILFILLTASGFLDIWHAFRTDRHSFAMWSGEEESLAGEFRKISNPMDRVLTSDDHHNWVPCLAGRPILMGYPGWLWTYGINYATVEADIQTMYAGGPQALSLMKKYKIRYAVISPSEDMRFHPNRAFFEKTFPVALRSGPYLIYQIPQ